MARADSAAPVLLLTAVRVLVTLLVGVALAATVTASFMPLFALRGSVYRRLGADNNGGRGGGQGHYHRSSTEVPLLPLSDGDILRLEPHRCGSSRNNNHHEEEQQGWEDTLAMFDGEDEEDLFGDPDDPFVAYDHDNWEVEDDGQEAVGIAIGRNTDNGHKSSRNNSNGGIRGDADRSPAAPAALQCYDFINDQLLWTARIVTAGDWGDSMAALPFRSTSRLTSSLSLSSTHTPTATTVTIPTARELYNGATPLLASDFRALQFFTVAALLAGGALLVVSALSLAAAQRHHRHHLCVLDDGTAITTNTNNRTSVLSRVASAAARPLTTAAVSSCPTLAAGPLRTLRLLNGFCSAFAFCCARAILFTHYTSINTSSSTSSSSW